MENTNIKILYENRRVSGGKNEGGIGGDREAVAERSLKIHQQSKSVNENILRHGIEFPENTEWVVRSRIKVMK